jgi:FAD synthase
MKNSKPLVYDKLSYGDKYVIFEDGVIMRIEDEYVRFPKKEGNQYYIVLGMGNKTSLRVNIYKALYESGWLDELPYPDLSVSFKAKIRPPRKYTKLEEKELTSAIKKAVKDEVAKFNCELVKQELKLEGEESAEKL